MKTNENFSKGLIFSLRKRVVLHSKESENLNPSEAIYLDIGHGE